MDISVSHNDTAVVHVKVVVGSMVHLGMDACNFLLVVPCKDLVAQVQHRLAYLIPHTLSSIGGVVQETQHPFR